MAAVLHGGMSKDEILWDLPLAFGLQCQAWWWRNCAENITGSVVFHGYPLKARSPNRKRDSMIG